MEKNSFYKLEESEQSSLRVSEPVQAYGITNVDDFVASLSKEMISQLADYAVMEQNAGRCIHHSQIKGLLYQRLGWK